MDHMAVFELNGFRFVPQGNEDQPLQVSHLPNMKVRLLLVVPVEYLLEILLIVTDKHTYTLSLLVHTC